MKPILLIAINTFRQTVRQRLFYNVVLAGVGMVMFAMIVSRLTFGFPDRVVRSIGLSGVAMALNLMAILVGVALIHQEIDRKTLFVLLTRPLTRFQYTAGRYVGLLGALAVSAVGLSVVFGLVLLGARGTPSAQDVVALSGSFLEAAVLGAVALVLSAFTTPTLGAGLGIGIWIISTTTDDLIRLLRDDPFSQEMATFLSYVFPSLARLNFREAAVYHTAISMSDWAGAVLLSGVYSAALVCLASLILSRREML